MKDYLEHVVCGGLRSGFRTHLEFITNQVGEKNDVVLQQSDWNWAELWILCVAGVCS